MARIIIHRSSGRVDLLLTSSIYTPELQRRPGKGQPPPPPPSLQCATAKISRPNQIENRTVIASRILSKLFQCFSFAGLKNIFIYVFIFSWLRSSHHDTWFGLMDKIKRLISKTARKCRENQRIVFFSFPYDLLNEREIGEEYRPFNQKRIL